MPSEMQNIFFKSESKIMKVAKATEDDQNAIYKILGALESISNGEMPGIEDDIEDDEGIGRYRLHEALDAGENEYVPDEINYFIRRAIKHLLNVYSSAHPMRAAVNLSALLGNQNEIVDPDNSTLEIHPKIEQGLADTERLNWLLSNGMSKLSKDVMFGSNTDSSNYRAQIDVLMEAESKAMKDLANE